MSKRVLWGSMIMLCMQGMAWSADLASWQAAMEVKRQTRGLVQLYTFREGSGLSTRNLLDDAPFSAMAIAGNDYFLDKDEDCPRWVGGRWPGKPALRIGTRSRSIGRTHFHGVEGKNFTLELWVRTTAVKTIQDCAVLASVGDAWSNGWRLEVCGSVVSFTLGRPPGEGEGKGAVTVTDTRGSLTPHVWHQVAAVLSDSALLLYIDGALAAQKGFDGVYRHPEPPLARYRTPELDTGGLQLGSTPSCRSTLRFAIGELAIFARAMTAAELAGFHAAGRPDAAPEDQAARHREELARQARLDGIAIDVPKDTFGYFPKDKPIPVTVAVNAAAAEFLGERAAVTFEVKAFTGKALASESRVLGLADGAPGRITHSLPPGRCGLYELNVAVRNADDKEAVKTARFRFAVRLPLPARRDIPDSSMLAAYGAFADSELPSLGTTMHRTIQTILGRTPDGAPNYALSDFYVDKCDRLGLGALYCIQIGIWEGKYPTVADWKRDPAFHQEHLRNLVSRYRGRVKYWEIFNEPNSGSDVFREMTPRIYIQMLEEARRIIKEVDPEALIVGPCGTYQYHTWTEDVLAAGGGEFLDILSFHNYIDMSPIENYNFGRVRTVKASLLNHMGRLLPLWNTECGVHQPARVDGRPATDEQLLAIYGSRAIRTSNGAVKVSVDGISMVNEHRSACWQVQSILIEMAEGVEKYFMLMRPSLLYPFFSNGDHAVTEKGVALAAMQSVTINAVSARFVPVDMEGAAAIAVTDRTGATTVVLFADKPVLQVFKAASAGGVAIEAMDYLGNPLTFTTDEGGWLEVEATQEPVYIFNVPEAFAFSIEKTRSLPGPEPGGITADDTAIPIRAIGGDFVLDLDPDKWRGVPEEKANTADKAVIGRPVPDTVNPTFWQGPDDLSYALKTAWTTDGIHFLVTVRDDALRLPQGALEEKAAWGFDCTELFVDCRPANERGAPYYSPGAVQFIIVPRAGDSPAPCPVRPIGKNAPPVVLTCVGKKTNEGYVVEGTIKPADGSRLQMKAGARFSFDVSVDDNDDTPGQKQFGRRVQMALHGRADNCSNTSAWGRYELRPLHPVEE